MAEYALVTGAARNIGRAIAARLKSDGYNVLMLDVTEPEDPSLGAFRQVDLTDRAATAEAVDWATDGRRVTRLVNCAGVVSAQPIADIDLAVFDSLMAVNVKSYIQIMQALAPGMKDAGFGRVVNIASRSALGAAEQTIYAASKAAVVGLTKSWAEEFAGDGITVNAVGPGPIETEMLHKVYGQGSPAYEAYRNRVPVKRFGHVDDIANGVSFFMDEKASFVTGQVLYICGGVTLGRGNSL